MHTAIPLYSGVLRSFHRTSADEVYMHRVVHVQQFSYVSGSLLVFKLSFQSINCLGIVFLARSEKLDRQIELLGW